MTEQEEISNPKIMIVEDEAIIAGHLKVCLQQLGYTVSARSFSGKKALEMIEQDPPDLVLMDIVLKGRMDGIEAAEIIRSRWGIPVVFITAHADQERLERAKLVYPFGYVLKPFNDNSIRVAVEMALYVSKVDAERKKALEALRASEEAALRVAHENAVIAEIGRVISSSMDIEEIYEKFAVSARQLLPFDRIAISVINHENRTVTVPYAAGIKIPGRETGTTYPLTGSMMEDMLRSRQGLLLTEKIPEDRHPSYLLHSAFQAGFHSFVIVPLIVSNQVIGALFFSSTQSAPYEERHLPLAENIANQIAGAVANAQLYLKRTQAEEALKRYHLLFESSHDIILFIRHRDRRILDANRAAETAYSYTREELLSKRMDDLLSPRAVRLKSDQFKEMFATGLFFETIHCCRDGSDFPVEVNMAGIEIDGEQIRLAIVRNISKRKRAEDVLRKSEGESRRLAQENGLLAEIGRIIGSTLTIEDVFPLFSEELKKILPFDCINIGLIDHEAQTVHPRYAAGIPVAERRVGDTFPLAGTLTSKVAEARGSVNVSFQEEGEVAAKLPGTVPHFRQGLRSFLSVPLIYQNSVIGALHLRSRKYNAYSGQDCRLAENVGHQIAGAIANAILYQKIKAGEEKALHSLKEKEVLLKEIHHRVKNNLQVISSLLSLQSRHIQNEEVRKIFQESQDRVKTMALIHEKLYRSGDLARIEFGEYIQGLVSNLGKSYGLNAEKIKLAVQVKDVFLEISTAIPCGLIINELISNVLKYAFPDGREGEILVDMRKEGEQILLRVLDNGVGFPVDLDFRETKSLGLQLVGMLVEQLGGTIELYREGGTEFRISFPKEQS